MTKTLNDVEWKEFTLKEIFVNFHGKRLIKEKRCIGNIPLLTASEQNQGISSYINNKDMKKYVNFISIDMFGHAFFHNYECCGDDNIYFFINKKIPCDAKLFITTCINKNTLKYSYGNQFRQDNADKDKILLPINKQGAPDYEFMEEYIKEQKNKLKEKYIKYVQNRINELEKFVNEKKEWKEFKIKDIFDVYTGGDLIINKVDNGKIPVISHSLLNNGIATFSKEIKNRKLFNSNITLSLADRGNFGTFVQSSDFYIGTRVKALEAKFRNCNKNILKFICPTINAQAIKFSYGNNCCGKTEFLKILLPINKQGEPDYKYMENYIKYLEQKKILKYLNFINKSNNI